MTIEIKEYGLLKDGEGSTALVSDIDDGRWGNARLKRDQKKFEDLREKIISARGVTQGVTVRQNPDDPTRLELIAGYGRRDVCVLEKIKTIPIVFKVANDRDSYAMMLSENSARNNTNIADEIVYAQKFVSLHNGDIVTAAKHLAWSKSKLEQRLLLNNCTPKVLDALWDNQTLFGHAVILATFSESVQNNTLKKILDEGWSLDQLKERAYSAVESLNNAIFDKTQCNSCRHNSSSQAELFTDTVGKSRCSNLPCYRDKTNKVLDARKAELKDAHSLVLLQVEKPKKDRNTVDADIVGEEQFSSGCTGCVNNSVIIENRLGKLTGEITKNQCVDTDCFRKMVKNHKESQQPEVEVTVPTTSKTKPKIKSCPKKKTTGGKAKTTVYKTVSKATIHESRLLLHKVGANLVKDDEHLREALAVSSLSMRLNYDDLKGFGFEGMVAVDSESFRKRVDYLVELSSKELESLKQRIYEAYISPKTNSENESNKLVLSRLAQNEQGPSLARLSWSPSEALLNSYLLGSLISICEKSGFSKYYEKLDISNDFSRLSKRKSDLIAEILASDFDWREFAPEDYMKILATEVKK